MGLKKILKKVKKVAKKVAPIAAPIVGHVLGGPVGAGIGGALGGAAKGGVKGALVGGALGYGASAGINALSNSLNNTFYGPIDSLMNAGMPEAGLEAGMAYDPTGSGSYWNGSNWQSASNLGQGLSSGATDMAASPAVQSGDWLGADYANIGSSGIAPATTGPYNGLPMPPPNINVPNQGIYPPVPASSGGGINWSNALLGTSSAANLSRMLKEKAGIDVDPQTLGMLGTGLATGLGYYGAGQQEKALQNVINDQKAVTSPFLNDAMDMFKNPEKFYQRPEVMGAIDASLRGLSAQTGNPYNNPGALAKQAAYNTGLYNTALNTRLATALGGQDTLNRLQTQQALTNGNQLNALGSGLGSMLSTQPNYSNVLGEYLARLV